MRLFIAINFTQGIKKELMNSIEVLKTHAERGNFTREENLHLTLVFIGETKKADEVKRVIDSVVSCPFELKIGQAGRFRRSGRDIWWAGIEKSNRLDNLYSQLSVGLRKSGFKIEDRPFTPHITLGREVVIKNLSDFQIPAMSMTVEKLSLMKSERVNGKLTYTEIYAKQLRPD